jgi:hypothetical protein
MRIVGVVLILGGLLVWAMMQFTELGYNTFGNILTPVAIITGISAVTEKKKE